MLPTGRPDSWQHRGLVAGEVSREICQSGSWLSRWPDVPTAHWLGKHSCLGGPSTSPRTSRLACGTRDGSDWPAPLGRRVKSVAPAGSYLKAAHLVPMRMIWSGCLSKRTNSLAMAAGPTTSTTKPTFRPHQPRNYLIARSETPLGSRVT